MRRMFFILLLVLLCINTVQSQHFFTPSIGYSLALYKSDDLDLFKNTYNAFHRDFGFGIISEFGGLHQPVGIRLELGYQYFGKLTVFTTAGFQNFITTDFAEFDNYDVRKLILKQKSLFIEGGIGPRFKKVFIAGTFTIYFDKKLSLESKYNATAGSGKSYSLDGEYESNNTISTDIGVAFGLKKEPIVLTLKISYPLYTGGKNEVLTDDNQAKIAAGTSVFPNNFDNYYFDEPYQGIKADIDGLKIIFTFGVPLRLKRSED